MREINNNQDRKFIEVDHPSDIGIRFFGSDLEELFENAASGMFSIMCNLQKIVQVDKKNIIIRGKSNIGLDDLLILWLEKLLYVYEVDKMLFSKFKVRRINEKCDGKILEAEILGEKINLEKHEIMTAIKAPTYHMLEVKKDKTSSRWTGQVIFDV